MSREPAFRWTVPDSWVWTNLSEVGDIVAGGTPSTKEPSYGQMRSIGFHQRT